MKLICKFIYLVHKMATILSSALKLILPLSFFSNGIPIFFLARAQCIASHNKIVFLTTD